MALRFQTKPASTRDDAHDEPVVLDDKSFTALTAALANPPRPNAKLRALFKK